jgi:hypothetical protein
MSEGAPFVPRTLRPCEPDKPTSRAQVYDDHLTVCSFNDDYLVDPPAKMAGVSARSLGIGAPPTR